LEHRLLGFRLYQNLLFLPYIYSLRHRGSRAGARATRCRAG
jgi:hypothetical protein